MTARLPALGGDDNTWGDVLNTFLEVSHNSDGTLQSGAISQAGGVTSSQAGIANGVASLNGSGLVPSTQLGSGASGNSNFLRGDGTWAVPNSSGVTTFNTRAGTVTSQNGDYTFTQVGAAQGLIPTAAKTSGYTASPGDFVPVDTSGGSVTVTLPTAPADKSRVEIKMINTGGGNTVTINTGGSDVFNKAGGGTSATLSLLNQGVMLQYAAGSPGIWYVQSDDLPLSQLDVRYAAASKPYQFSVATYGAKGDGKVVTDAVMTSNSANLACTTSTPFFSSDIGKYVLVSTAKGSYAHLMSTISTYTDSGHVALANSATATTGGTPGAIMYYGTDDTAAIQSAINAAVAYANAHDGYAEVLFDPVIYIIAGGFNTSAAGNNQIALPIISPTAQKLVLAFKGPSDETPLMHWDQLFPQANGTVLASVRTDGGSTPPASIIGGPVTGYGGEPGTYSNALIKISGLATLAPYNATMGGIDLFGMLEADVESYSAMTAAVVPTSSAPVPSLSSTSNISNQYTYGLRMPATGNQVVCRVGKFSTEGYCYGLGITEWTHGQDIHAMYCIGALGVFSNGVTMAHHALIDHCQSENCYNAIIQVDNGLKRLLVTSLGVESVHAIVYDPSSYIYGEVCVMDQGSSENYQNNGWAGGSGGLNIVFINKMSTGGVIGPPSVPASDTAFFNYYYRDATIYLTSGGVAVSAIAVDSSTTGLTLGTSGTVMLRVPSGHSLTLTYASTAPTWTWILD